MANIRVNGELIKQFRGHNVCLLGKLKKLNQDQTSFELEASDGKLVVVKLKMPLRDVLSDYVEVYGEVDDRGFINCVNYATFDPIVYENFDFDLYNETIMKAHELPKHYAMQASD